MFCVFIDLVQLISMNFLHCGSTFKNGNSVLTGNTKKKHTTQVRAVYFEG